MTRASKFAATLTVIAVASLASTGAFAHGGGGGGGGGGFGGGGFGGGHAGGFSGGGFSAPANHSFVSFPGSAGYNKLPVAGGIARSSIIARKPVLPPTGLGGAANSSGHSNIPTQTLISQFPKGSTNPPPPGNNSNPGLGRGGVSGLVSIDAASDNCLIKRYLPNGRVLFRDICTDETALAR